MPFHDTCAECSVCSDNYPPGVASTLGQSDAITLPVSSYGELEGSFTTLDARVRWNAQAIQPFGQSRYLPAVLADIAVTMGGPAGPSCVDDIWEQMRAQIGGYNGISPEQLRSAVEADLDFEAVPRNQDDTHEQREYYSPIEVADPDKWQYTVLARYDAHWWIYDGRMWSLPVLYREMRDWRAAHVLMNPEDMAREQLRSGRPMILATARGRAEVQAYPHPNLSAGLIVVPAHQRHLLDQLMGPGQYDCRSCALVHRPTSAKVRRG
jgi:anaerobic selenocysteine-containing dehydrogenase